MGQTFTVLKAASIAATFSNSTIAINSTEHFGCRTSANVVLTVASGPVRTSGTTAAAAASQMALASTKQVIELARNGLLRAVPRKIGGGMKPVLGAGLKRPGERSRAIFVAGTSDFKDLRTSRATPILSAWNRAPEKFSQAMRDFGREALRQNLRDSENHVVAEQSINALQSRPISQNVPAPNNWVGVRQNTNIRPTMTRWLGASGNRGVMPVRIMRPSLLPLMPIRLGR